MAKWGSPRVLESELKAESRHIRTIIKARGLWYPNVNGKTFAVFRTDKQNHLVSLVSTKYRPGQPNWEFRLWIFHSVENGNLAIFLPL